MASTAVIIAVVWIEMKVITVVNAEGVILFRYHGWKVLLLKAKEKAKQGARKQRDKLWRSDKRKNDLKRKNQNWKTACSSINISFHCLNERNSFGVTNERFQGPAENSKKLSVQKRCQQLRTGIDPRVSSRQATFRSSRNLLQNKLGRWFRDCGSFSWIFCEQI